MRFLFIFLFFCSFCDGQNLISKDYFQLPLDIPMQLAGNFAELRPNHFHAGFDFKTNQREGLPIFAVADGYVSRIKISNVGYGKAIYITHPNGYTSVYGHLQKAVGIIETKIITHQYEAKSYEIESFFTPGDLPISKGQQIAISGNTGGSEGPHLHFEIRDNKTEKSINPLLFGYDLKDTKPPKINNLVVFPVDDNATVNQSKRPISLNLTLQADGTYLAEKVLAIGKIGFGIIASDFDDVSYNNNGIYKTQLIANGKPIFGYEFDQLNFDEARVVNALIDYDRYKKTHQRVQKLFMKSVFEWSNVTDNFENGIITVEPNFTKSVRIEVSDFKQNKVLLFVPIAYSNLPALIPTLTLKTPYFLKAKTDNVYEKENWSVSFPAKTFYDDFYLNFNVFGASLKLHDDTIPAQTNFTITYDCAGLSNTDKLFIASKYNGKLNYIFSYLKDNILSCKTKTLGDFEVARDTIAPKISINKSIEKQTISNLNGIKFTISDDFSGIKSYNAFLNNQWILMEYESKLKRLLPNQTNIVLNNGTNILKVIVVDNVGNSTTFETQFNVDSKN